MDAYQRRDQVGLIVFQRQEARLALPPTNSVERAQKLLRELPVGGKTPLSHGLFLAHQLLARRRLKRQEVQPLLIVITDGAGNVSLTGRPPQEEALQIAEWLKESQVRSVVINTEHEALDRGLARSLADALGARYYSLSDLRSDRLVETVRQSLTEPPLT